MFVNYLGFPKCACQLIETVTKTEIKQQNFNTVCELFCDFNITIDGCSKCGVHQFAGIDKVISNSKVDQESSSTESSETEPDWDAICLHLCKIGEGGVLCNCDLPPFF